KIKTFWIEKDPTPTTVLNERLIEHWQRIAYARKNFNKTNSAPYGTDDRGPIYVKYGKPDRERTLTLGTQQGEMYRWGTARGNIFVEQSNVQSSEISTDRVQERELLRKTVGRFNYFPECDVWLYRDQSEKENVVYLFGPRNGNGAYGLRNGIEELIPDAAFQRFRSAKFRGLLPGALIQLMYYRELVAFDSFFADRYSELEAAWSRADARGDLAPRISYLKGMRNHFKTIDAHDAPRFYAPTEQSNVEESLNQIDLTAIRTRILEHNNPKLVFVAFAYPQNISKPVNVSKNEISTAPKDSLHYTVVIRDQNMEQMRQFIGQPFSRQDFTSVISIDHKPEYSHSTLAIHSIGGEEEILTAKDITQPYSIGKEHFALTAPLDPDTDRLEISDLVIGVQPPTDFDINKLPFPIVPGRIIWRDDPMQVYLEVYHLQPDKQGIGHFNLEFRVIKLEIKKDKLKRKEVIASSFDYDSPTMTAKEHFGVSIVNLEVGNYEVEVEVQDSISKKKKQRSVVFEIRDDKR
ncbi:MAG: GWxTD domain-containing protein, partial [bacterium]